MLNKKSQVEDWLPLLLLTVIAVFAIFFYISYSNFGRNLAVKEKADSDVTIKESNQILLNYLKSPIIIDKISDANIADAISYYSITGDAGLLNKIKTATDGFFSKSRIETDYSSWSLEIKYRGKELIIESEKSKILSISNVQSETQLVQKKELTQTIIPTHYNDQFIEIRLFILTTKPVSNWA